MYYVTAEKNDEKKIHDSLYMHPVEEESGRMGSGRPRY
jgi:hypothetical protein